MPSSMRPASWRSPAPTTCRRSNATKARAKLALSIYCYRIAQAIGAMAVALGGLDAIVFTAGVGEHSALIRTAICARLASLGVELDPAANDRAVADTRIERGSSAVAVHVIRAREDVVVARAVRKLGSPAGRSRP